MNIIFPMTGPLFYKGEEYHYPKPLIPINGKLMIERSIERFKSINNVKIFPVILKADAKEHKLDDVLKQSLGMVSHETLQIENKTAGALCTCLLAMNALDLHEELIISNYDQNLDVDVASVCQYFRDNDADFGVICFDSVHPKWSYVKTDSNGLIVEAAEKRPISRNAVAGFYYFKSGQSFIDCAEWVLTSSSNDHQNFYISESINKSVLMGKKGLVYSIDTKSYRNFYDSNALKEYVSMLREYEIPSEKALRQRTADYVKAFDVCDLSEIGNMLTENCSLFDPCVGLIAGRSQVLKFISEIFSSESLNFVSHSILVDDYKSCIEFLLTVNGETTKGVDIITWESDKISKIYAYLEGK